MKLKRKHRRRGKIGTASKLRYLSSASIKGYTDSEAELLKFSEHSNALDDPFTDLYEVAGIGGDGATKAPIQPDYDLYKMCHIITISNILRQCIEAIVTNTTSYGYTLEYTGPEGSEKGAEQKAEKKAIKELLDNASPGETFRQLLEKFVWDKETVGFRALEVIRDETGSVISFNHIPAVTIRKTRPDLRPTQYAMPILDPETGKTHDKIVAQRFRRYVQKVGNKTIYFKEFGDPRDIDYRTGEVITKESDMAFQATEIIYDEFYTPGAPYGQPRWMGVLPAILGSRESELVNLNFFRENAIPAMAVLVSGGALSAESFDMLRQYMTAVRGKDAMHRVMILEASADETGSTDASAPAPKIDMKPMISERQQDGLFKDYDNHNIVKVRSAFRMPPILVGKAEDYTRASALASVQTAENQMFGPERSYLDDLINNKILATHGIRYWRFRLLGPATTDAEELAKIVDSLGKQGALTPNVVIKLANKVLGVYIEPVLDDWGDYPFSIIESMIDQGTTIKGLTEFIEEAATALDPEGSNNQEPPIGNNQNTRMPKPKKRAKVIRVEQARKNIRRKKIREGVAAPVLSLSKKLRSAA